MFALFPTELQRLTEAVVTAGSSSSNSSSSNSSRGKLTSGTGTIIGFNGNGNGTAGYSIVGNNSGVNNNGGNNNGHIEAFKKAVQEAVRVRVVCGVKRDVDQAMSSSQGFYEVAREHRALALQVASITPFLPLYSRPHPPATHPHATPPSLPP